MAVTKESKNQLIGSGFLLMLVGLFGGYIPFVNVVYLAFSFFLSGAASAYELINYTFWLGVIFMALGWFAKPDKVDSKSAIGGKVELTDAEIKEMKSSKEDVTEKKDTIKVKCSKCKALNDEDSEFCKKCGKKL